MQAGSASSSLIVSPSRRCASASMKQQVKLGKKRGSRCPLPVVLGGHGGIPGALRPEPMAVSRSRQQDRQDWGVGLRHGCGATTAIGARVVAAQGRQDPATQARVAGDRRARATGSDLAALLPWLPLLACRRGRFHLRLALDTKASLLATHQHPCKCWFPFHRFPFVVIQTELLPVSR